MIRRLPHILAALAGLAALLLLGPIALAVALLRSSPEAAGPSLAAQLLIAFFVLAAAAMVALAGWGAGRLVQRLLRRRG